MKYQIRRIPIDFKVGKIISFESQQLTKILDVEVWASGAVVTVLERWGEKSGSNKIHKIIIMEEGQEVELTFPYEPTLSRRAKFNYNGVTYYTFSL
jgi:hypothetical protein